MCSRGVLQFSCIYTYIYNLSKGGCGNRNRNQKFGAKWEVSLVNISEMYRLNEIFHEKAWGSLSSGFW